MVKHVVLFKLKNKNDFNKAKEALLSMRGRIEGLIDIEVGENFTLSARSYDIALITTHTDKNALDVYQAHEVHQPVKKIMHSIYELSAAVDFEC